MSAKKTVVITMASLMIAGSGIAGEKEGKGERRSEGGERGGKNRQEQMQRQHKRGGGMQRLIKNTKLQEELGITAEQVEQLKSEDQELKEQREKLVAQMKEAREKQMTLMKADELDKKAIMQSINESGKIRTKLEKLRVKGLFRTQDILTDEQLQEVKKRMRKGMQKHKKEREGRSEDKGENRQKGNRKGGKGQSKTI